MGEANKILRNSIHVFFQNYHSFVSIAALLALPFSASLLLSQALITSSPSSLNFISSRIRSLFHAAGFPPSSTPKLYLYSLLNLMVSQTIFSTIFTLPFTLTFLLLAKASIIRITREFPHRNKSPPLFSSLPNLYSPLILTHLFSRFILLSANAAIFTLLFLIFNAAELLGLSSNSFLLVISFSGAILYSVVLANTVVICNLSIIVSAMEKCRGYHPVLRSCMLIRGRITTALSIALPTNLAMAAVEALFQYKVVKTYNLSAKFNTSIICEAFTIAYMHSVLVVLEIIASCLFYKNCRLGSGYQAELEPEDKGQV